MEDYFKIIVCVLKQLLQKQRPLFDNPKNINIEISDGVRICHIYWNWKRGAKFDE